jgi:aspartyl-tRNA(Asn)/glutamyl-tRNA(Gln) amidotransferase subunit A
MAGIVPLSKTLDHVGPICRSVRDARILLEVLAGPTPAGWSADAPVRRDLSGLKVGVLDQLPGPDCSAEVTDGFANAVEDIRRLGADIVPLTLPGLELRGLRREAFLVIEAERAEALATSLQEEPAAYSDNLKAMLDYGRNLPAERLEKAYRMIGAAKKALEGLFEKVDLLVSPTAPQTAFSFDDPAPANQAEFTGLANVSGCPAISLPCGLARSGLPLAFQIMAAPYNEAMMLGAAEVLETAWGRLTPPMARD